jgi:HAD superfamily hydrolase (TIGR01484 family)
MTPSALLCFDFDGTFVDSTPDWAATSELIQLLERLRKSGAAWAINTGRTLPHALDGLVQHGIQHPPDFLIAREGEIYVLNELGRWVDLGDWNIKLAKLNRKFVHGHLRFFRHLRTWLRDNTLALWVSDPTDRAGIIASSDAEMDVICAWIDQERLSWPELDYQRSTVYLRFTPKMHNKGVALAELANYYEIPVSHRFAMGDSHNDLPMLHREIAACLACPGNAVQPVKAQIHEAGGFRTDASSTKGCVEALEFYFFD